MDCLSSGSYWLEPARSAAWKYGPLKGDRRVDVAVIGAGITGLTVALHLKQAGKRVAVLEASRVGMGTTGGTSGHLDVMPERGFTKLARNFAAEAAVGITRARGDAIDQIENWVRELQIDCDFRRIVARAYTEQDV